MLIIQPEYFKLKLKFTKITGLFLSSTLVLPCQSMHTANDINISFNIITSVQIIL